MIKAQVMSQVKVQVESHMPPEGLTAFMAAHMQPCTSGTTHTAALLWITH